jgi:hypothetical protein
MPIGHCFSGVASVRRIFEPLMRSKLQNFLQKNVFFSEAPRRASQPRRQASLNTYCFTHNNTPHALAFAL